jgi:hypothetical protein
MTRAPTHDFEDDTPHRRAETGRPDGTCPICGLRSSVVTDFGIKQTCSCPRCGDFRIALDVAEDIPCRRLRNNSIALLSYYCRRAQRNGQQAAISREFVEAVLRERLPTPAERLDNLILALGNLDLDGGSFIEVHPERFQGLIGSAEPSGVSFIAAEATRLGLAASKTPDSPDGHNWFSHRPHRENSPNPGAYGLRLTMEGWRRYEELGRSGGVGLIAFMAMQFGDAVLDTLIEEHVRPSVLETGFTLRRLNDRPKAGLIDDRLRVEIRACRFLIADLSHSNPGAYWEAGFAEGLQKPVIYLCRRSIFDDPKRRPHFDTNHHLTIPWEPETAAEDMRSLKATIRFSIPEARQIDS